MPPLGVTITKVVSLEALGSVCPKDKTDAVFVFAPVVVTFAVIFKVANEPDAKELIAHSPVELLYVPPPVSDK